MAGSRLNSDYPSRTPLADAQGFATAPWNQTFGRWQMVTAAMQQSGATAVRPVSDLWVGRMFYDTTLGKPVWVHAVRPTVWHDASGASV